MTRRHARVRRGLAIAAAGVVCLVGCQLIVSSDVPEFHCTTEDPSGCPTGLVCDLSAQLCVTSVSPIDGGAEGGPEDGDATDAGKRDADSGPLRANVGEKCAARDCKAGLICGTSTILTTAIVPTSADAICTATCCTSRDCPTDFICFSTGTGGNYCVSAAVAMRSATGPKTPGEVCDGGTECRSGLCDNGRCLDSCCSEADCSPGTTCRVKSVAVPPPSHETWACAPPGTGATTEIGNSCSGAVPKCKNDNCSGFPLKCRPPCCSASSCGTEGPNFGVCAYGTFLASNSDTKWCFDKLDSGTSLGTTCSGDVDCNSRLCDPETKKCAAACCRDSDCPPEWACRPSPSGRPLLRCVEAPKGT
jgi:hypothetical protein